MVDFDRPSKGLQELLFNLDKNIDLEIVDKSDVAKYINILKLLEINPGTSKRFENIKNYF